MTVQGRTFRNAEGEVLGSVPAKIVRSAECDVLVVQTSALHEEV